MFGRRKRNPGPRSASEKYRSGQVVFNYMTSPVWVDVKQAIAPGVESMEEWSRATAAKAIEEFGWAEGTGTVSKLEFAAQLNGWANVAKVAKPTNLFVTVGLPAYGCPAVCWIGASDVKNATPESELADLHKDRTIGRRLVGGIESEFLDLDSGRVLHARYRMNDSFGDVEGVVEKDCYTIFSPIFEPPVQIFGSWIDLEASEVIRPEIFSFVSTFRITPRPEFARPESQA